MADTNSVAAIICLVIPVLREIRACGHMVTPGMAGCMPITLWLLAQEIIPKDQKTKYPG